MNCATEKGFPLGDLEISKISHIRSDENGSVSGFPFMIKNYIGPGKIVVLIVRRYHDQDGVIIINFMNCTEGEILALHNKTKEA